jgi:hypothetical protein
MKYRLFIILLLGLFIQSISLAQSKGKTENIVLILIDGLRWQEIFRGAEFDLLTNPKYNSVDSLERMKKYWAENTDDRRKKLMPFIWSQIAANGQLYGNRDLGNKVDVANPYWFSYPGRAELLSGYVDEKINSNGYKNNTNMNVLEFIHSQKAYNNKVCAFACWTPVGKCLNKDNSKMMINIPWENITGDHLTEAEILANEIQHLAPKILGYGERLDFEVYALAKAYIQAHHPKVTYLDMGDTDEYAHSGHYDSYLEDIHQFDQILKHLWDMMQGDAFYKGNTTFVIVTDHGRGVGAEWTSHNSDIARSQETWLMVMGPDSPALGEVKTEGQIYQTQYAATIAHLLGLHYTVDGQTVGEKIQSVSKFK